MASQDIAPPEIELLVHYTLKDALDLAHTIWRRDVLPGRLFMLAIGLIFGVGGYVFDAQSSTYIGAIVSIAVIGVLVIDISIDLPTRTQTSFNKLQKHGQTKVIYRLNYTHIEFVSENTSSTIKWDAIALCLETPTQYVLRFKHRADSTICFPKTAFVSADQQQSFRALIHSQLKPQSIRIIGHRVAQ